MENRIKKTAGLVVGMAVALGLFASPAAALSLQQDLASISDLAATPYRSMTDTLNGWDGGHGTLKTDVYQNGSGLWTYVMTVTPHFGGITEFWTNFAVAGSGNSGWSWADAAAANTLFPAAIFKVTNTAGYLDWNAIASGLWTEAFWNQADANGHYPSIRFFYQSIYGPGATALFYGAINSTDLSAQGWAPSADFRAAEPGTLLLLASGLLGAGVWARLRRARA